MRPSFHYYGNQRVFTRHNLAMTRLNTGPQFDFISLRMLLDFDNDSMSAKSMLFSSIDANQTSPYG